MTTIAEDREWLEADGLGGYAMGTSALLRTRRYHALLCAARKPPVDRVVLVAGIDAWLQIGGKHVPLVAHRYAFGTGDTVDPDGRQFLRAFAREPWPTWTFACPLGGEATFELFVPHGRAAVALRWQGRGLPRGVALHVRPLLAGRDHHALHFENTVCNLRAVPAGDRLAFQTYAAMPRVLAASNGRYAAEPHWFRGFVYSEERARGYDWREDLASPGTFVFDLGATAATLLFAAEGIGAPLPAGDAAAVWSELAVAERRRRAAFPDPLQRAGDAYVVRRGDGLSVIAGYPWFADWGRDTFLAMRGLLLATGRLRDAHAVLRAWLPHLQGGLLPNRFPDGGEAPEYNSVDASLWFAVAAGELLARAGDAAWLTAADRAALERAILAVADGCQGGCRHGIRVDDDGLLRAGAPGTNLTWMDAVAGGRVVTPRIGKPVEIEALWLEVLRLAAALDGRFRTGHERARASFRERFWNDRGQCLFDVVDADHEPGAVDDAVRCNQILAVGGLPVPALTGPRARAVVDAVEKALWTPLGLRTLAPGEGYEGRYQGDTVARDLAYHQGTAWPWLLGPFVEAWVRVRGDTDEARAQARARFVAPLLAHLEEAGLGHVSEVADGDLPQRPGGAPFQAWSLGELLRLQLDVLREPRAAAGGAGGAPPRDAVAGAAG